MSDIYEIYFQCQETKLLKDFLNHKKTECPTSLVTDTFSIVLVKIKYFSKKIREFFCAFSCTNNLRPRKFWHNYSVSLKTNKLIKH